jgi:hypothetical protein
VEGDAGAVVARERFAVVGIELKGNWGKSVWARWGRWGKRMGRRSVETGEKCGQLRVLFSFGTVG